MRANPDLRLSKYNRLHAQRGVPAHLNWACALSALPAVCGDPPCAPPFSLLSMSDTMHCTVQCTNVPCQALSRASHHVPTADGIPLPSSFRYWCVIPVVRIVAKQLKERQAVKGLCSMQKCFNIETSLWGEIIA